MVRFFKLSFILLCVHFSMQASWQENLGKHMRNKSVAIPQSADSMASFLQQGLPEPMNNEDPVITQVRDSFAKLPTLPPDEAQKALKDAQRGIKRARGSVLGGILVSNKGLGQRVVKRTLKEEAKRSR